VSHLSTSQVHYRLGRRHGGQHYVTQSVAGIKHPLLCSSLPLLAGRQHLRAHGRPELQQQLQVLLLLLLVCRRRRCLVVQGQAGGPTHGAKAAAADSHRSETQHAERVSDVRAHSVQQLHGHSACVGCVGRTRDSIFALQVVVGVLGACASKHRQG
jgi:hypothetical protein